jgi:hypothetical protein
MLLESIATFCDSVLGDNTAVSKSSPIAANAGYSINVPL